MDNWFILYLLTRSENFQNLMFMITLGLIGGAFLCAIGGGSKMENHDKEGAKWWFLQSRKFVIAAVATAFVTVCIPSTKDLMFIVGGDALLDLAQSDSAQRVAGKSVQVVEKWLTEQLQEAK